MNETIARRLKQLRTARGMTQDDLAEKMHMTRQAISNWETGKTAVSVEYLTELAVLYGVTVDEIIYGQRTLAAYRQHQVKYIVTAAVCAALMAAALILNLTLVPYLKGLMDNRFLIMPLFLYVNLRDVIFAAAVSVLVLSLISLKGDIRVYGRLRRGLLIAGIVCVLLTGWFIAAYAGGFLALPGKLFKQILYNLKTVRILLMLLGGAGLFAGLNR